MPAVRIGLCGGAAEIGADLQKFKPVLFKGAFDLVKRIAALALLLVGAEVTPVGVCLKYGQKKVAKVALFVIKILPSNARIFLLFNILV